MYVSLVLAYLGRVGLLAEPWPLVFLPLPVEIVDRIVIPFEEPRLRDASGGPYDANREKVRRWI